MRRPVRLSIPLLMITLLAGAIPFLAAQEPPRPLPPSITGTSPSGVPPVSPASGVQTQPANNSPAARYQDLTAFPPETVQAVYSVTAAANWLSRMNQASGRFLPGLDPTLRTPITIDHDLRQAFAARSLAEAARFTGQEEFAARATQAVLALLSQTKPDPKDAGQRVPDAPSKECNRVGFAAVLVLAIRVLPGTDTKLQAQADELCAFLWANIRPDGSIQTLDQAGEVVAKSDADGVNVYPGLAIQALAASNRMKPDAAKQAALVKIAAYYRGVFKSQPTTMLAATLLPGVADLCLQSKDTTAAALVVELADYLCACQYSRSDARSPAWVGGFRPGQLPSQMMAEPGADSALCAQALVGAIQVSRQVSPDLARFRRYRQAVVDGLAFSRRLQFSDENADHFEKGFRARFLAGGVHLTPTDGTLRVDATAHLVAAQLAYLQSGAERPAE